MSMELLTFKTSIRYNKAKPITERLRYFWLQKYRHCMSVKKILPKHSMVIFGLFYFQEKFEKSIVLQILTFFFKICEYKVLKYIQS